MRNEKLWIFLLVMFFFATSDKTEAQIAVIVNESNSCDNLSTSELERIFLGKITTFSNGDQIVLVQFEPLSKQFYHKVLHKTPMKVRKHWINMVFSGGSGMPPKECSSLDQITKLFADHPGAISFVELSEVLEGMKVVSIDSKLPQDEDYPLK
ncbi:MAG: hypothetical protein ACE5EE_02190 [Fidelibacterota bacterium]